MDPQLIQSLLQEPSNVCVSLYMPMYCSGRQVRQNEIRLRNLMKDTQQLLEKDEVATSEQSQAITQQLEGFLFEPNHKAWQHPSAGLAVFLTPDSMEIHPMSYNVKEQAHVGERFYLRPLLPALHGSGNFVLLAVSQKHVRLFEGTSESLEERHPDDLPDNLQDALNIDEYLTSLQHFSYSAGGDTDTMYHGHGAGDDDHKSNILQFFHRINEPLCNYLEGRNDPLIFAGVEFLYPMFKEAIHYKHLLPDPVTGNFDDASTDELHKPSCKIAESYYQRETTQAIENYNDAYGRNRATDDLETILQAAQMGAIDTLLIREGTPMWGHVDSDGHVQKDESPTECSLDLLDEAAVETLEKGGDVFTVSDEDFPAKDRSVVAQLRFDVAATVDN